MIIALHGFTGTPAMWDKIGLTGPALLGHSPDTYASGKESFADEVKRLTNILPTQPVHLVGYSLGARLSLAIALAHPERVRALTLIGCNPGIEDEKERMQRIANDSQWCERLRTGDIDAFVDAWQGLPLWASQGRLPVAIRQALRRQRLAHNPEQLARAMTALGTGAMPAMWTSLDTLAIPVQIVAGALDAKYTEIGQRMYQALQNATLHSIANAGHNPVLEQPQSVLGVINEVV